MGCTLGGCAISIPFYTVGIFMVPWEREFGWQRSEMAVALSIHALFISLMAPVVGAIVDRFGVRTPALLSLGLLALALAAMSQIGPSIWSLYAVAACVSIAGSATTPVAYTRVISEAFDRARGLALGLVVSTSVLTALFAPAMAYSLIDSAGWRASWIGFGLVTLAVIPIVGFGFAKRRAPEPPSGTPRSARELSHHGVSLRQAAVGARFWRIAASFFFLTFAITGAMGQISPLLRDAGLTTADAILAQSLTGLGLALGRIGSGMMIDRFFGPAVYRVICIVGAVGLLTLALGSPNVLFLGCIMIGLAIGAEFDILAYLVSRYYGLREYGKIYGWLYAVAIAGGVASPVVFGAVHDATGTYQGALLVFSGLTLVSALLLFGFEPYPDFKRAPPAVDNAIPNGAFKTSSGAE